ncbi:MAG: hypothetical protein JXA30_14600 [Deltaproteobacteria bacterium]|nr:hypothetical protein [Deltaproteobacteria bacterium]
MVLAQSVADTLYEKPPSIIDLEKPPQDQEDSGEPSPDDRESRQSRLIATITSGGSLRIARNVDLGQERFGPIFVEGFVAYLLPFGDWWRHGIGVGVSTNLMEDGGYTEPVDPVEQLVVSPGYLAYFDFHPDIFCLGHLSLPFQLLSSSESWAIEAAAGIGYKLSAGAGAYIESSLDFFVGFDSTVHPIASLEVGIFLDHELLP